MVGSDGDEREQAAEMDRNAMRLSLDRLPIVRARDFTPSTRSYLPNVLLTSKNLLVILYHQQ